MLKILIVKDESSSQHDLTKLETQFQDKAKFRRASDLDTALDYLDRGDVSCILLDSALTDVDGRDAYATLRANYPEVPVGLLVGEDGNTHLLNMDGGKSFHLHTATGPAEIFRQVVTVVERLGPKPSVPIADLLSSGRLGPDATTKPPRNPLPVIVEASGAPSTKPDEPVDDLTSRVRALEEWAAELAREMRFMTWVVAIVLLIAVVCLLRS